MIEKVFERNPKHTYEILKNSTVGIAGCGGLGSNAAAALVRSGVGSLVLSDFDRVELTNLNRQYFTSKHIGMYKVQALEQQLVLINQEVKIRGVIKKLQAEDISETFNDCDVLIEAFDGADSKKMIIETWRKVFPDRYVVCASGMGGMTSTQDLKIRRIGKIIICGDEKSSMELGLIAPRVISVAMMQAMEVLRILTASAGS
ncbi:sulfur carrier protein ThiS adenylyltransferase ThiF [Myxococcota bacterium]|nr:sulfur carrier protein ThiS adenylyltransferase ThiF [Myxococcota bacterium]MBU1381268.1 sulfur carrier protein ThiS adenylyltransferase ThiF [Myxococcota bacterium]MBU1498273.1 sulfur carrier protein ThiS adenylyltransferase ThiF [Myxococcota bacterium]